MTSRVVLLALIAMPMSAMSQSPAQARIVLERTPCYGTCPAYRLELRTDGAVAFTGLNQYAEKAATRYVGRSAVDSLTAFLDRVGFFSLDTAYTPGQVGCRQSVTDHPSFRLSLTRTGQTRTIEYYYGCLGDSIANSPDGVTRALRHPTGVRALLVQMAAAVDSVGGVSAWLTKP